MKIIFVTRSIIPSRTADSIQSMLMCEAFARLGHDVVLLTRAVNGDTAVAPDRLHSFYGVDDCFEIVKIKAEGRKLSGLLRFLRRSAVFIRKSQPDLVYSRDLWSCYLPSLLGITTFYEVHRQLEKSRRSVSFCLAVLMKLKGFKQIITVSEALKKLFAERYRVEKSRIKTLPNGARRNRGSAAAPVALGGNGRLQAGYAGNLFAGKGMETIAAIAPAAPEVDFHVIGGEQSDIDYWRARIDSPNLHFHGFVEHGRVPDYLAALDVCLLPNRKSVMTGSSGNEGSVDIGEYTSPLKLFEYMAAGKPVIASDIPVIREVLNPDNAVLADCDRPETWVSALNRLKDPAIRAKIADNARRDFNSRYALDLRAGKILSCLR